MVAMHQTTAVWMTCTFLTARDEQHWRHVLGVAGAHMICCVHAADKYSQQFVGQCLRTSFAECTNM